MLLKIRVIFAIMMENNVNISHVFYIDEEGLISETKYNKPLDSLKGDDIKSFYDENIDVYNISGVIDDGKHFILNNKKELIEYSSEHL